MIVAGASGGDEAAIHAAANVAWALCRSGHDARLCFTVPECNSLGLAFFGERNLDDAFKAVHDGQVDTLIVLENDLYRRDTAEAVDGALRSIKHLVVIDHSSSATTAAAEILLPGTTFAESQGTLVNNEGRAQRFFEVMPAAGDILTRHPNKLALAARYPARDRSRAQMARYRCRDRGLCPRHPGTRAHPGSRTHG